VDEADLVLLDVPCFGTGTLQPHPDGRWRLEAGHPDGFSFTMLVVAGFEFQTRHAQAIQEQLEPLGIEAEIQVTEWGIVLNSATSGEFDAIVLGFSPTFDPDERVQQTFVCEAGINWPQFCDPTVDELAAEARQTTDRDERAQLYNELQRKVFENGAWASLYMSNNYDATQSDVKNYTYYPQFYYRSLREVWLDE
jgi:ABC-type transport system substrate-binding protein